MCACVRALSLIKIGLEQMESDSLRLAGENMLRIRSDSLECRDMLHVSKRPAPRAKNVIVEMLNTDVLVYLCGFMHWKTLVVMANVCTDWRSILNDSDVDCIWRKASVAFFDMERLTTAFSLQERRFYAYSGKTFIDYETIHWCKLIMPSSLRPCMSSSWWTRSVIIGDFFDNPKWLIAYTIACLDLQRKSMELLVHAAMDQSVKRKTRLRLDTHVHKLWELRKIILRNGCEALWWFEVRWEDNPAHFTIGREQHNDYQEQKSDFIAHENAFKEKTLGWILETSDDPQRFVNKVLHPGRHLLQQLFVQRTHTSNTINNHEIFGDTDGVGISQTFLAPLFETHLELLRNLVCFVRVQFLRHIWIANNRAPFMTNDTKRNDIRRQRRMQTLENILNDLHFAATGEEDSSITSGSSEKITHKKTRHTSIYSLVVQTATTGSSQVLC